jgi:P2-related tail formation protein
VLLARWLGLQVDEAWPIERKRELVRRADELARRHGTKAGLELTLKIAFPQHPLRVEDSGKVTWSTDGTAAKKSEKAGAGFVVYCDAPLDEQELGAVSRLIEHVKPVNVTYKLRVKAPRRSSTQGS